MKYCDKCGKKLDDNEKICSDCKNIVTSNPKKDNKTIKILLWIFFLPIMLCIFIWNNKKINKKYKIPLIVFIAFVTLLWIIGMNTAQNQLKEETLKKCYFEEAYNKLDELYDIENIDGNFESGMKCSDLKLKDANYNQIIIETKDKKLLSIKVKDGKDYKDVYNIDKSYDIYDITSLELKEKADENLKLEREKKEQEEKDAIEKVKKLKIFTNIGLSEENAEESFTILNKCGINNISKLEKNIEKDGVTFYKASGNGYPLTISIYNNRLHFISSGTLILFDRDDNLYRNINNYVLSTENQSELKTQAEYYVKQILKAPSTAKFPGSFLSPFDGWQMQNDNGIYKIKSYVDSQNSFGAMIRSEFYMEFKKGSDYSLTLTKFTFDGEKIK